MFRKGGIRLALNWNSVTHEFHVNTHMFGLFLFTFHYHLN